MRYRVKYREYSKLLPVLGIALLVRFLFVLLVSPHIPLAPDTIYGYDRIANNILSGSGFSIKPGVPTVVREPLYPLFISYIYFLFGYNHTIVRIIQAILDSLTCIMLYLIGKKVYNEKIGYISALAFALYPVSIYATGLILTETLFTFLLSLFILSLLRVFKTLSLKYSILSGLLLGVLVMTRGSVSAFPVFVLIGLVLVFPDRIKLAVARTALIFLIMAVVVAPWAIRNYRVTGKFIPVRIGLGEQLLGSTIDERHSGPEYWLTIRDFPMPKDVTEVKRDQLYFKTAVSRILKDPLRAVWLTLKGLYRFWYWTESGNWDVIVLPIQAFLVFTALVGIVHSIKHQQMITPLILVILYFMFLHAATHAILRYAMSIMPYVILFASYGISVIINKYKFLYSALGVHYSKREN